MELPLIEIAGTPAEMGHSYGEQCRRQVREFYQIRMALAREAASEYGRSYTEDEVLDVLKPSLALTEAFDAAGYAEMCATGEAADLTPEQMLAVNGLTDVQDLLRWGPGPAVRGNGARSRPLDDECSSFIVAADRAAHGAALLGQNWDMHTTAMPFITLVRRRPVDRPRTCAITTAGCLTLIGINEAGVGVGNTNLLASDSRSGVQYLSILHRALGSTSIEEATDVVIGAHRMGGHYYYVAGPNDTGGHEARSIECTATDSRVRPITTGLYAHCNHYFDTDLSRMQAEPTSESSAARQRRMEELLVDPGLTVGADDIRAILSDHEGAGANAICRHDDEGGVSSDATVIMSPQRGELSACRGQPHVGVWRHERLRVGGGSAVTDQAVS